MEATPLEFESVSATELQLGQLLCNRKNRYQIQLNGTEFTVSLEGLDNQTSTWQAEIELSGYPSKLYLGQQILDFLLPKKLDHQVIQKLPSALRDATINSSLTPIFNFLSQMLGQSVALSHLKEAEPTDSTLISVNLEAENISTRIQIEHSEVIENLLKSIPPHQSIQLPDIPLWVSLQKGSTVLTRSELNHLEAGDIVFLEEHVNDSEVIVRIKQNAAFMGTLEDTRVTISQRLQAMEEHSAQEQTEHEESMPQEDAPQAPAAPLDLHDLPVTLMFEVGEQQLTFAELQNLTPGYVFQLSNPLETPVKIRANGQLIGKCQLVEIEGRLGARITELTGKEAGQE
ncbi:type III secretion system cytoplasmic ring protein SctQ [Endozoicomonas arenosclerae]|uniref:type III secretion system cytoplasmic ring protein SctQ n=1 Tax=Endozoicomonas arenosclerae TaxID=1633495 RepID=UPI000783CE83|nr:type III secretion system cytoplasmic ring protein SctQ [Endozoicomonas arenosclerae]